MDEALLRTLLLDYYGDLLTEKQRECYDLHYNQDLSLQEIAEHNGSSRQAVWDLVRRAESTLREIEDKTGLVRRALRRRAQLAKVCAIAQRLPASPERQDLLDALAVLTEET